jgi:sugar phosphate isomerase/epimerase
MNHPAREVLDEIRWIGEMGLDFVDLTLEPPQAAAGRVNPKAIRETLDKYRLKVVGHTAYYLPIGSPFEQLRRATVDELKRCMDVFAAIGTKWMNVHPDREAMIHNRQSVIESNLETLSELISASRQWGLGIMIENLPLHFNTAEQLAQLLDPLPDLGLHLDIGHANLRITAETENSTEEILNAYGSRLRHVHLHDNKGGSADLHLPLGAGNLDLSKHIACLKTVGYDGTITLEVFSSDPRYLAYSVETLRRLWWGPLQP